MGWQKGGFPAVIGLANDYTINFNNSYSASDINGEIDAAPRITNGKTLTFHFADGVYINSEEILIDGFTGGSLNITGNESEYGKTTSKSVSITCSTGRSFNIRNCSSIVYFRGFQCTGEPPNFGGVLQVLNCTGVYANGNSFKGVSKANNNSSIIAEFSKISVYDSYVDNTIMGIYAGWNTVMLVGNTSETGTSPDYGIRATRARLVKNDAILPAGTIAAELDEKNIF